MNTGEKTTLNQAPRLDTAGPSATNGLMPMIKRIGIAIPAILCWMLVGAALAGEPSDVATPKLGKDGNIDAEFIQKHQAFLERGKQGNIGIVFLGDSITAGWFWSSKLGNNRDIWNAHFGKYDPVNFGIGGDRTEHVLWRINNGELDGISPKVLVLLIGTNNIGYSTDEIIKGDTKIVDEIHQKLPETKVLILGIFPRGANPANPQVAAIREKIKTVNEGLAKLDDGDKTRFLDVGPKLVSSDGTISKYIMPDYLHVNYIGYAIWADAMQPLLDEMMK
jgi:lysophospholipase L1-like esterase